MALELDREGIFKLVPIKWGIRQGEGTQSVAINIQFRVVSQLSGSEWVSWEDFEEHTAWGAFYVIKRDGTINVRPVDQLVDSIGWDGDLRSIDGPPPDTICQGTVKENVWNGKSSFRVDWLNAEDYTPEGDTEALQNLQMQFGSQLKAAAKARKKATGAPPPSNKKGAPAKPPSPPVDEMAKREADFNSEEWDPISGA